MSRNRKAIKALGFDIDHLHMELVEARNAFTRYVEQNNRAVWVLHEREKLLVKRLDRAISAIAHMDARIDRLEMKIESDVVE